ncbi:hypothetical protein [Candidatus Hodarchaeum mangrovi]
MANQHSETIVPEVQKNSVKFKIIEMTIVFSSIIILIIFFYIFFITSNWISFYFLYFIAILLFFIYFLLSPTIKRKEIFQIQLIKLISILTGLGFTLFVLMIAYGDQAVIFILKGISLQNLVQIFENLDFFELFSYFYFLILFFFLIFIKRVILEEKLIIQFSDKQRSILSNAFDSFKEGSLNYPVVIMIIFPLLLQVILPMIVNIIVFVELFLPFILIGELYQTSEKHLIAFVKQIRIKQNFSVTIPAILILAFPIGIFVILETGLISFFNLVHYNFLWENPDSFVALAFWGLINSFLSIVSFNNIWLLSIYTEFKYYFITFFILAFISKFYLLVKHFIRIQSIKQVERFILTYET